MPKLQSEACLLCGAELEYFTDEREMQCVYCGRTFKSTACCKNGHYVCDECHSKDGIAVILSTCRRTESRDPIAIMQLLMGHPAIHMHGPEHHVLVGAALIAAYCNSGGTGDREQLLELMAQRGGRVPGGICGFWGCCGAAVSSGIFISLVTGSTPTGKENWGLSNRMTSRSLAAIGEIGGPRCCKRDSFTAVLQACTFVSRELGVDMQPTAGIRCTFSGKNRECIGPRCPYNPGHVA